jgi:N-acylglucosamine 2-epimerase
MTTSDGKPVKIQRTIFCECFYIMAMAGLYQATNEEKYKVFSESYILQCSIINHPS